MFRLVLQKARNNPNYCQDQFGQTLIETMVAIFILVMGITSAVGLAIYAYSSASNITKQIIATGLAREGVEAVKNMRDTNWLKLSIDSTCYNYQTGGTDGLCYTQWLNKSGWNKSKYDNGFNIDPGNSPSTYTVVIDPNSNNKTWNLNPENTRFGLDLNTDATNGSFSGFYTPSGSADGTSDYYRQITLVKNTTAPYMATLERIQVISRVWWTDKKCPRSAVWPGAGKCSIELNTYLTNWKNYQS